MIAGNAHATVELLADYHALLLMALPGRAQSQRANLLQPLSVSGAQFGSSGSSTG
jgi:hypothetical protein